MADQSADVSHFKLADLAPYFEGLFQSEWLQDWKQTSDMQRPSNWETGEHETNSILGKHPSQSSIRTYFPLMGLAHAMGYEALPDNWKLPYSLLSSVIEAPAIMSNADKRYYSFAPGQRPSIKREGYNLPLAGLGGLITYFLVNDYNKSHKDSQIKPYAAQTNSGTPVQGVTMKW